MNCWFLEFRERKSQTTAKMTMCHSIESIGYHIQAHWQNSCTIIETVWAFFDIVSGYFLLICQVRAAKNTRCAWCWRSPWVKYYKFQKSPTHFCFTTSKKSSGQISQKSAEFWYPILKFIYLIEWRMVIFAAILICNFLLWNLKNQQFIFFTKQTFINLPNDI